MKVTDDVESGLRVVESIHYTYPWEIATVVVRKCVAEKSAGGVCPSGKQRPGQAVAKLLCILDRFSRIVSALFL